MVVADKQFRVEHGWSSTNERLCEVGIVDAQRNNTALNRLDRQDCPKVGQIIYRETSRSEEVCPRFLRNGLTGPPERTARVSVRSEHHPDAPRRSFIQVIHVFNEVCERGQQVLIPCHYKTSIFLQHIANKCVDRMSVIVGPDLRTRCRGGDRRGCRHRPRKEPRQETSPLVISHNPPAWLRHAETRGRQP